MQEDGQNPLDLQNIHHILGGTPAWVAAAFVVFMVFLFNTIRIERVSGEQVGFLLNKITGRIEIIERSGAQIYNGLTKEFYVLDRTLQTMEMTENVLRGDRKGRDDLKIKTIDGSDVYVDLKVQYRIIPELAETVIRTSGPGDSYKVKWARDYIRSVVRNHLGEMKTEEFYNAEQRSGKLNAALLEVNKRLNPMGIKIDSIVVPRRPHFYKEYEDMIKRKKLADQAVLEEQSKALAAKQRQQTMIVQETNKLNVAVEEFSGEMRQLVIAAEAEAERARKEADAYYERRTVAAEAELYQLEKAATATLAKKSAEAAGIKALKEALEGEGGRNMVKLEYAKKLRGIKIEGRPFTIQGKVERFEHLDGGAVFKGRN